MTSIELAALAASQLGVKESPPCSNQVIYNTWYYGRQVSGSSYPWCMVFVQWVFAQAGVPLPLRTASCGALMRSAQKAGCWVTEAYQPGDVVIYNFSGGGATDHCGIIESVQDGTVTAIEGNTGADNDADGGQVQRRVRKLACVVGAVRPQWKEEEEDVERFNTVSQCPSWARDTVQKLVDKGYLGGSGEKDSQGCPTDLDLSLDMLRLLVIQDRAGNFS